MAQAQDPDPTAQDPFASFRLDGMVALITGAAGAIGAMAAGVLARAGAQVMLTDRDADGAERAAATLRAEGLAATAGAMDVTREAEVAGTVDAIVRAHGRLDVLVNNAAMARRMPAEVLSLAVWNDVVAVNLTGVFLCAREAGRQMLQQRAGSIINIASIMGHVGGALYGNLSYHATKGGVVNLTRALAVEWGDRGVRVNALAPTFVDTPFAASVLDDADMRARIEALTPLGRVAQVDDLAGALLFLASPASAMVSGHSLAVDGGWLAQ